MNLNKKIGVLLDNGFKPEFISSLNESKINFLFEKMSKRKENKEATTTTKTEKVTTYTPDELTKMKQQNTGVNVTNGEVTPTPQGGLVVKQQAEGEIKEKFESKAQQGLFWARCNKCKTDECKWCKMANEFSKSTSKKQYKTMPEKKHPEKTVKYKKKKETNEEFTMANYFDKVASAYSNNVMGRAIKSFTKEQIINKHLTKLVESNLRPTMKKRDLLRLIENQTRNKKSLNEDFYFGGEMGEDDDFMMSMDRPDYTGVNPNKRPDYTEVGPPKRPDYTEVGPPDRRKPIRKEPDHTERERPRRPNASYMSDFDMEFMNEPAIKEPITKPKTPTEKPKERPRRKPSRETPYEQPATRPQGDEEDFDIVMERLYNRLKRK